MMPEFGIFFLILALLAASWQAMLLFPSRNIREIIRPCMHSAVSMQALLVIFAFVTLMLLRIDSDFSVANVALHSNRSLPLLYKIAGTWGNHEGSMVLWALVLSLFALALSLNNRVEEGLKELALAVQAAIACGVLLFILFTSNPFERNFPPALDGEALNPLLQDIGLALHPPLLYLGYVGFSMVFALAVAALLRGHAGRQWAEAAHGWIVAAWSALTLGIGLGSWWAYRELGWGGWWFWDPVENASLMPWLAGTALLHCNIVFKKRGQLQSWTLLLAIVTFTLSLLGTFLVRSGVLTSVHSFASDPARGLFIILYTAAVSGSALLIYALRADRLNTNTGFEPVSREGLIVINNIFVLSACATVLLGTLYPLIAQWYGARISVGPPYFNKTFLPMMALPLMFAGLAPFMGWQQSSIKLALAKALPALTAMLAAVFVILAVTKSHAALAAAGFGLSTWLAAASIQWILEGKRVRTLATTATFVGHLGAAVLIAGITAVSLWKTEAERNMAPGDTITAGSYLLTFRQEDSYRGANYDAKRGELSVQDANGNVVATLFPEYRLYDIRKMGTSEAAIYSVLFSDVYAVIGEGALDSGHTAVRVYYVPLIQLIWGGFLLIGLSGILALVHRART